MAKREIPLFIFDLTRKHGLGDVDFVSCTDIDSGFIARISFCTAAREEVGDTYRITTPNVLGISAKIEIKRIVGLHPDTGRIRTLLKKAMEEYTLRTQRIRLKERPDEWQMIAFLNDVIRGNQQQLHDAGSDYAARQTVEMSLYMLECIKEKIEEIDNARLI